MATSSHHERPTMVHYPILLGCDSDFYPGLLGRTMCNGAFSGLEIGDPETGEFLNLILTPSSDNSMLDRYVGTGRSPSRVWRTVTPIALPDSASRRRIEPARMVVEAKAGAERAAEQGRAKVAVVQALRHAEVRTRTDVIRVQREPFEANGERVEAFAPGTRFAKERLWHVEITFNAPIAGPLVIGDGRFLGLGVMAPVQQCHGAHCFVIGGGLVVNPSFVDVTRALRRAVMARVQYVLGPRASLPAFFTGHELEGSVTDTPHLSFLFDPEALRLFVVAPHLTDRRDPSRDEIANIASLDVALTEFRDLLAGSSGRLTLRGIPIDADADPLFSVSRTWESVTPYQVTRHPKHLSAADALSADLRAECCRRGLPEPRVTPRDLRGISGVGLVGGARLTFEVAVHGPIVLGKSRHLGGGLFIGTDSRV